jgi:glycosyltransferase involved in cell wall biosynthesis
MKDYLHIALVSHRVQKNDGQGRVNYEIARTALAHGHRLTILAAHCSAEIAEHPLCRLVVLENHRMPTQLLRNLSFAQSTAQWLGANRAGIDIVQANGFTTWAPCNVVAAHFVHGAWKKSPYYPYGDYWKSPYTAYQRTFTALNERWEREAFANARAVVAVSERVAEELRSIHVPANKITVIYNGVDTEEFSPGVSNRTHFKLPEQVPMALFVGDLKTSRKNLATVLQALQRLPNVHLAVGGNLQGSPYPALAEQWGLSARVHFLGRVSEMALLMRSVDCFVFPTRYDPLGLVILEAMATGLPVITSAKAGGAELLGSSGRIMPDPDDVALLTQWLSELMASPALRQDLGGAARSVALANQWEAMAGGYLGVYEKLSAGQGDGMVAMKREAR